MIIKRYINAQILQSSLAVLGILFSIIAGSRIIKYFYMATQGRLDVDMLFSLLFLQSPAFLEFILPLSFFLGVMLSLGRMYVDSEMAVLSAVGLGPLQLLKLASSSMVLVLLVSAGMTLYLTPRANYRAEELFSQQASRNTFEILRPGMFQPLEGGKVIYVRSISDDRRQLEDVFVYGNLAGNSVDSVVIRATHGRIAIDPHSGARYLILISGERDEIQAGSHRLQRINFASYSLLLTQAPAKAVTMLKALTGRQLMQRSDILARAELEWRLSLVLLVPVVAVLAQALSRVQPRQGRFLKLLPGILVYLSYIVLLLVVKQAVEKGHLPQGAFLWVHIAYTGLAFYLLYADEWRQRWQRRSGLPTVQG